MRLERYLLKKGAEGIQYFGDHIEKYSYDYMWYFGDKNVGIRNQPSTEAESFVRGLLVRESDALIVTPSATRPRIVRKSESYGMISGRSSGGFELINPLVELLQGTDVVHLYYTSLKLDGTGTFLHKVLTFSPEAPTMDVYVKGTPMEIIIRPEINYDL